MRNALSLAVIMVFFSITLLKAQDPLTNYQWSPEDENTLREIVPGTNPFGEPADLLQVTPDGNWRGYEFDNISINPNMTYRFSFWAKVTYDSPSYTFTGKIETNNGLIKPDNTQTGDKYIQTGWAIPGSDNWYLYVGFVNGNADQNPYTGGIYSTTSLVGNDGANGYRFTSNISTLNFSASFNSADPNNKVYLYDFRIEAVNDDNVDDLLDSASGQSNSKINLSGLSVEQSSNNYPWGAFASVAIDGNTNGQGAANVTHTLTESDSWWRLDLGAEYDLTRIDIYNRTDTCCNDRLTGTKVYLGAIESDSPSDYQQVGNTLNGSTSVQQLDFAATGRYILVSQHDKSEITPLSIAELEVYGTISNSDTGDNDGGDDDGGGDTSPPTSGETVWTTSGNNISYTTGNVDIAGNLAIGRSTVPSGYKFAVEGNVRAREIRVDAETWPDYVFTEEYHLPSLQEIQKHIQEKGHLPNMPSAKEVEANGIELGEMNRLLLEKIEELTLYLIEQEKQLKEQKREIENLKN